MRFLTVFVVDMNILYCILIVSFSFQKYNAFFFATLMIIYAEETCFCFFSHCDRNNLYGIGKIDYISNVLQHYTKMLKEYNRLLIHV